MPLDFNIVIERCPSSVVSVLSQTFGFLGEADIIQVFAGVVAGFSAIHNQGILNRDGKIENILLTSAIISARNVRICDFGSCTRRLFPDASVLIKNPLLRSEVEEEIRNKATPQYRAPEMVDLFSKMPITTKSDVFALGVVLYRLMYKTLPFPEGEILANFNVRYCFPDETREFLARNRYAERDDVPIYSDYLKNLVRKCLVKDPRQRASVFEIAKILEGEIGPFGAEAERADIAVQPQIKEAHKEIHKAIAETVETQPIGVNKFNAMLDWTESTEIKIDKEWAVWDEAVVKKHADHVI